MKKCEVSTKGLEVLRDAAREAPVTGWDDQRKRDVTEALKEADDRLAAAQNKE